jgi:hypothetical protein
MRLKDKYNLTESEHKFIMRVCGFGCIIIPILVFMAQINIGIKLIIIILFFGSIYQSAAKFYNKSVKFGTLSKLSYVLILSIFQMIAIILIYIMIGIFANPWV